MSNVPVELVVDILHRLPAKPLFRFRSVSKPWCALIDSPDFIKSHLNRSLENNPNRIIILGDGYLYNIDFDSLYTATAVQLDYPFRSELTGTGIKILGSIHGLLCLCDLEGDIVLWNPSTRKHLKLPFNEIECPTTCFKVYGLGFGYDHLNNDYKVVKFIQFIQFYGDNSDSIFSEVNVYSMKSNSCRRSQDFPYCIRYKRDCGTLVNGALHWVVNRKHGYEFAFDNLIAAFDLGSEEYRLVPQPVYADHDFDFHMGVAVLRDCLSVYCNYYPLCFDLWVMKEYGVKESWTKLLSIAQPCDLRPYEFLKPVAYSKSGVQVLLEMRERHQTRGYINGFFWYDLEKKSVSSLNISGAPNYFDPYICVESLVQLNGGGARDVKKQRALEKKKKIIKTKKR